MSVQILLYVLLGIVGALVAVTVYFMIRPLDGEVDKPKKLSGA